MRSTESSAFGGGNDRTSDPYKTLLKTNPLEGEQDEQRTGARAKSRPTLAEGFGWL